MLGIDEVDPALYPELAAETVASTTPAQTSKGGDDVVDALLALRAAARKAKDFAKGDQIRTLLVEAGVEIEDSPQGTRWTRR